MIDNVIQSPHSVFGLPIINMSSQVGVLVLVSGSSSCVVRAVANVDCDVVSSDDEKLLLPNSVNPLRATMWLVCYPEHQQQLG